MYGNDGNDGIFPTLYIHASIYLLPLTFRVCTQTEYGVIAVRAVHNWH